MIRAGAALLVVLAGGGVAGESAHPAAFSRLTVRVEADVIRLELRMQELTLREVPRWWLDTDNDRYYSTLEIERQWPQVAALLEEKVWFELDGVQRTPAWTLSSFEELGEPLQDGGSHFEFLVVEASMPRPADPSSLSVHSDLFLEDGNPGHRMHVLVEGIWDQPAQTLLDYTDRDWRFEFPSTGDVLLKYGRLGFEHVLIGWDHLAFLAALLLGVAGFGALLGAITAFTLAHSLTLALAAFGVLRLPAGAVEPAIAWSVLLVALLHLRLGPTRARAWIPAFGFGLLHGLGFAGVLGDIGLPRTAEVSGLLGFNLGVEAGQLAFVLPLVLLAVGARRVLPSAWPALRSGCGLIVLAFALFLTGGAVRDWWLPLTSLGPNWAALLLGAGAAAMIAVPTARLIRAGPASPPLRALVAQAALLVACYAAGSWLSGLRG
ncbi:MAG: HupE/UreJ family protein [Planctomycetota bacterium]|nr:HupE/UreJ family protein [Planctomycetota bacterium]